MTPARPTTTFWWKDLLIITLAITLLFGTFLGSRSLSVPDEARYSEIPREMLLNSDFITPRLNAVKYFEKPILVYWMQSLSLKNFGLNEWAARLPTALMALFGCLMTYGASRVLYGRNTGLFSTTIQATSLLYFVMAHLITLDMTVSVLLTGSLLSFLLAIHSPTGMQRGLFMWSMFIFAAFATLAKGLIGIIFPGMIIGAWLLIFNEWHVLKSWYLPCGILLFLLIALPWHILVQQANPEFFKFYVLDQQFLRFLTKDAGRYKPDWFFIPILFIGFFPWIAFLLQAIKYNLPSSVQQAHYEKNAIFLFLWATLIFIFFSLSNSKLIPYILPVIPPLAILTGRYLDNALTTKHYTGLKYGSGALLIISLAVNILLLSIPHYTTFANLAQAQIILFSLSTIITVGSMVATIFAWRQDFKKAFAILIISISLFLITFMNAIPQLDSRSIKPFAIKLKPLLKPNDEVVSYNTYYQDLPFYLQRRITVIRWQNELSFGMKYEDTSQWMISNTTFQKRWQSPKRMFLVTSRNTFEDLYKKSHLKFYVLEANDEDVLVANQPVKFW